MMINWAEKQKAPEDKSSNWGQYWTQWRNTGLRSQRAFVESEDEQEQQDNLELCNSDHVAGTTDKPGDRRET